MKRHKPTPSFTALLLTRKYVLWRCALVCERLRCEPWRPWGWGIHSLVIEKEIRPMRYGSQQIVLCGRCSEPLTLSPVRNLCRLAVPYLLSIRLNRAV